MGTIAIISTAPMLFISVQIPNKDLFFILHCSMISAYSRAVFWQLETYVLEIIRGKLWYLDKQLYVLWRQVIVTLMNSRINPCWALHMDAAKLFQGVLTYKPSMYNKPKSEKGALDTNSWSRRWFRFPGTGFTEDHRASCQSCSTCRWVEQQSPFHMGA